ncbi:hypothetical protein BJV77DRAFT_1069769 [Russula vinacea]|nr:hypothetical protein BJV77DRAFT_1069769 [Russula vinacea]
MISEGNAAASTQFPEMVSGNENTSGLPDRSEVPPDQRLGSEAPPDVPMDPRPRRFPPRIPKPPRSLRWRFVRPYPSSSPQREDSVTGGMRTPLGHDKLVNIFDVTRISKDKYQYTVHWYQCPDNTQEFHEDLEGSLVLVAFWNEFKGGRSAMKINEKRVATKEFVDRRRDAFLDVEGTLNVEEVNKPRADIGPRKCLVGARIEKGRLEYMLRWFSYVENEATWEPAENVTAEVLVSRFGVMWA